MQNRLTDILKAHDAEYADIRIEENANSWINYKGYEIESIGSSKSSGGIVRALYKGGWGYASFNNLDELDKKVKEACRIARLIGSDKSYFADADVVVESIECKMKKDFRVIPVAEKIKLLQEYNKIILGHHKDIQTSELYYNDSYKTVWYANSEGTYIKEEEPFIFFLVVAFAKRNDTVQSHFEVFGSAEGFQAVENQHDIAAASAKKAVEMLSMPVIKGGKYTLVLDNISCGTFTHEAFGHLSESKYIEKNPQMRKIMKLGKRFGAKGLNIIDDGSFPGLNGTHKYDSEGVPMRKNCLIKDGILCGRLHSRETSARMKEPLTGNSRTENYREPPDVRMTNTYIEPGRDNFDDMISGIKSGVYMINGVEGQTEMEMFTVSADYGYMIRNGKLAEPVRGIMLTGNIFETLMNIDMIGNDLKWERASFCGNLNVGAGGPHIRIQNCTIGGQQ